MADEQATPDQDPATAYAFGRSVLMEAALSVVRQYHKLGEGETEARAAVKLLAVVWADAVRSEWYDQAAKFPTLNAQFEVARAMMRAEQYDPANDPIVMPLNTQPYTCSIGHKQTVCLDHSMPYATPLSAIFTGEVIAVDEARAQVVAVETAKPENG